MAVHGVVVAERVGCLGPQHLAGEDAELAGQLALGEALERAGRDVADGDSVARPARQVAVQSVVARVKMSTSMPRLASRLASSST